MTYTNVAKILVQKNKTLIKQYKTLIPHLENLYALYQVLYGKRVHRGALEFDSIETRVVFGRNRKIDQIVPVERNDAHRLIEECMLLANVAAAHFIHEQAASGLYRIHEGPKKDKLDDLRTFLSELGLSLRGGTKPKPKDYSSLLATIETRPDRHLIQTVLLRSLCQAVYSPDNLGHFGLAYEAYTHFTSPIRRYPDLIVHRIIGHLLTKPKHANLYETGDLAQLGTHCSMTERRADEAVEDALSWLKCEYMQSHIGEEFDGIITGVTGFGLFVELKEVYVEGLLHITALENDYFQFDPQKHRLVGERTRLVYRLADPIRVKVVQVDLDSRRIDYALVKRKKTRKDDAS
jgi:ribonuclease R